MKSKPIVTFVIVTWNNENEIKNCLNSIKKYTKCNYCTIVVDNNSEDKTTELLRTQFPEVLLIENKTNNGFAIANNQALRKTYSEYICYLNPDVELIEDIINPAIQILKTNCDVGLVSCRLLNEDRSFQPSCYRFDTKVTIVEEILHIADILPSKCFIKFFPYKYTGNDRLATEWVLGAEMVLRTSDALAINGFSTDYYMYTEDMDLCKKIKLMLNKRVLMDPSIELVHYGGKSESSNTNYNKIKLIIRNKLLFIEKYEGITNAIETCKAMLFAYRTRTLLVKLFYYGQDRKIIINKTEMALSYLVQLLNSRNFSDAIKRIS